MTIHMFYTQLAYKLKESKILFLVEEISLKHKSESKLRLGWKTYI